MYVINRVKHWIRNIGSGTSLVMQWLRVCLPMQRTRVWAVVWEDPTCRGATKPVHHNYWACALEPSSHNYWACVPQLLKPVCLELMLHNKRSHSNKKPVQGFPGGAVVEGLPANAGDTGSNPGLGGCHMLRSNWAREPQLLSLRVCSLCSSTREAAIVRGPRTAMKSGPRLSQLEKALAQKRRPNTAKKKKKIINQSINKKFKRGIFIKKIEPVHLNEE